MSFGEWLIGSVLVGLFVLVIFACIAEDKEDKRLLTQCIADGKKEYECKALLKRPRSNFIYVPMAVGR